MFANTWHSPVTAILVSLAIALPAARAAATEHVAALVYRGQPAGVPRVTDLATIKAAGFDTVAWPSAYRLRTVAMREMAEMVGLAVVIVRDRGLEPGRVIWIDCVRRPEHVAADAWRAFQQGAKVVVFDSDDRAGVSFSNATGQLHPWVDAARMFSRQLMVNVKLFDQIRPAAVALISRTGARVRVSLDQTPRAWLLVATNVGPDTGHFVARLPKPVPTALWVSLVDTSEMSMPRMPAGPTWTANIRPGEALVYLIDR